MQLLIDYFYKSFSKSKRINSIHQYRYKQYCNIQHVIENNDFTNQSSCCVSSVGCTNKQKCNYIIKEN